MKIHSSQLVAYLLSNTDELMDAFDCKESDLKEPLCLLNTAPDLLAACEMMLRLMEGENLDEKFDGEAEVLRDAIAKTKP